MKLLIIVPISVGLDDPFAYPPMGPLMIGAAVREAGHTPEILFAHWEPGMEHVRYGKTADLSTYTEMVGDDGVVGAWANYGVVGINIFSEATHDAAQAVLNEIYSEQWVIGGGAFVTSGSEEALKMGIDIAVIDEGEKQVVEVLDFIDKCGTKSWFFPWADEFYDKLSQIHGIAYLDKDGNHVMTPHREYVRDLDELPFPAWDLIQDDLAARETHAHLAPGKTQTTVFVTRGCPWNCTFCNREVGGRLFRMNSPEYIIRHLNHLRDTYGVTHVRFPDDMFTTVKKWVFEVSRKLKEEGFTWAALSRTDVLDDELAGAMADGGCQGLFFGIESGSQRILDLMRKKTTPEKNVEAIHRCKKFGMTASAYLIFGFPGENEESVDETIAWLEKARPDRAHYSTYLPIVGTDPRRYPERYNIEIRPGFDNYSYYVDDLESTQFPVVYLPPNPSNEEMMFLRLKFEDAFQRLGYRRWKEKASVMQPEPI